MPSNPVMALMIGAMIIQGIQPGPAVVTEQPALFLGIIASMWIGNFFLIVLNLPIIFLQRPISATMLVLALIAMTVVMMPALLRKRGEAFVE